jgi:hypothetical protein
MPVDSVKPTLSPLVCSSAVRMARMARMARMVRMVRMVRMARLVRMVRLVNPTSSLEVSAGQ